MHISIPFRILARWKCLIYFTFAVLYISQGSSIAQAAASVNYIQGNYAAPQTPQSMVIVTFNAAQSTGNLNVVVVGWNDTTAVVNSVSDKTGNTYTLAVGPTKLSGSLSQSIYYAKNIAAASAGANLVTVNFSEAAIYPDIRVLEYGGIDPNNPVDVTAARSGNNTVSASGKVTTTSPTDLIFGANMVATYTSGPASGFTLRIETSPDGDIAEDKLVTVAGSYNATAPVSPSGTWIMQMVAFRAASGDAIPPSAPTDLIATVSWSQINLSWTASTDNVGVTGYRVERCQGAGCTAFSQIATATATTYSDIGLAAGDYSYRVRATDAAGNLSSYSNVASATIGTAPPPSPVITSPTTASGAVGAAFSYQITATNSPTSYGATGLPAGLSINTGTGLISGTPTSAGTSTLTLSASNGNGTGNATLTLTIAANARPSITSATTASGIVGVAFSYQITATNSPTSYNAIGLPAGLSINTGTGLISGTPTSAGTSTLTLSASNASGTGNATLTLTITSSVTLSVTPSSTTFGNVTLGSSNTQSVTLNNTSSTSIMISQANVAGNEFSISGLSPPLTLAAGQNHTFSVVFTPASAGTVTGNVSLLSNAGNSPTVEPLSGTGIHHVDLSWQPSTSSVAGYNVYRGTASGGPYTKVNSFLISGSSYTDTTVQPGQTNYYVSTAVDSNNNESAYSNQATAVVPSP